MIGWKRIAFGMVLSIVAVWGIGCSSSPDTPLPRLNKEKLAEAVLPLSAYGPEARFLEIASESGLKIADQREERNSGELGYLLQFNTPEVPKVGKVFDGLVSVASSVTVFDDAPQASEALDTQVNEFRTSWLTSRDGAHVSVEMVDVGNEGIIVSFDTGSPDNDPFIAGRFITLCLFRRANIVGSVALAHGNERRSSEEVSLLAGLLDERIQVLLDGK